MCSATTRRAKSPSGTSATSRDKLGIAVIDREADNRGCDELLFEKFAI
jgi:hypothetical protein